MRPIVVHGGGPQIAALLKRLDIKSEFVNGLRVTDAATVEVVEMVLAGSINKQIVSSINGLGGRACGISGKDGGLMIARKLESTTRDPVTGEERPVDLGFVGDPEMRQSAHRRGDRRQRSHPGDRAHRHLAGRRDLQHQRRHLRRRARRRHEGQAPVAAHRRGGRPRQGRRSSSKSSRSSEARRLIADGTITGGMIPKVEGCIELVEQGVEGVVIINGKTPHAVLLELFTEHGAGTLIERG